MGWDADAKTTIIKGSVSTASAPSYDANDEDGEGAPAQGSGGCGHQGGSGCNTSGGASFKVVSPVAVGAPLQVGLMLMVDCRSGVMCIA